MKFKAIFALILATVLLVSCQKEPNENFKQANQVEINELKINSDGITHGNHQFDCNYWENSGSVFVDTEADEEINVSFESHDYRGHYLYSCLEPFSLYQSDYYSIEGGQIAINHQTKSLIEFSKPKEKSANQEYDYPIEYAKEICDDFVDKTINSGYYQVITKEFESFYNFQYTYYLDNMKTVELVSIGVSRIDGSIVLFSSRMMGEFESDLLSKSDENIAFLNKINGGSKELIDKKIESIYSLCPEFVDYEIKDSFVCKLDSKNYGMIFVVDVSFNEIDEDGETVTCGELLYFIIK